MDNPSSSRSSSSSSIDTDDDPPFVDVGKIYGSEDPRFESNINYNDNQLSSKLGSTSVMTTETKVNTDVDVEQKPLLGTKIYQSKSIMFQRYLGIQVSKQKYFKDELETLKKSITDTENKIKTLTEAYNQKESYIRTISPHLIKDNNNNNNINTTIAQIAKKAQYNKDVLLALLKLVNMLSRSSNISSSSNSSTDCENKIYVAHQDTTYENLIQGNNYETRCAQQKFIDSANQNFKSSADRRDVDYIYMFGKVEAIVPNVTDIVKAAYTTSLGNLYKAINKFASQEQMTNLTDCGVNNIINANNSNFGNAYSIQSIQSGGFGYFKKNFRRLIGEGLSDETFGYVKNMFCAFNNKNNITEKNLAQLDIVVTTFEGFRITSKKELKDKNNTTYEEDDYKALYPSQVEYSQNINAGGSRKKIHQKRNKKLSKTHKKQ
jgi:hypothetical protein